MSTDVNFFEPHQFLMCVNQSGIIQIQNLPNEDLEIMLEERTIDTNHVFDGLKIFQALDILKTAFVTKEVTTFPKVASQLLRVFHNDQDNPYLALALKYIDGFYETNNRTSRCVIA